MGYQTDFIGYLRIDPPLNEREYDVVNRISNSNFLPPERSGLRVADAMDVVMREVLTTAPRGWSNWRACDNGCCISYDGGDKANHMAPWLRFIMSALLVPGASAAERVAPLGFTCDHVLNGMVVGSRRDNGELYAITVDENVVEVELLWPGSPEWSSYPKLAYQTEIDRFREWMGKYRMEKYAVDPELTARGWD